jgi:hypothetical protein
MASLYPTSRALSTSEVSDPYKTPCATPDRVETMTDLQPSRTLSVGVNNDPAVVFAYITDARNLPHWAGGLARTVVPPAPGEQDWTVEMSEGPARLRFVDDNPYGVADHRVTVGGQEVLNPMRVLPNASGAEVLFTLFQRPGVSDVDFERDQTLVQADLERLAAVLDRSR